MDPSSPDVGRSREGASDSEFDALVQQHRPVVMSSALRYTGGDRGWAEDVVQETFIRAWRHFDQVMNGRGSIRGWLIRVAHNVAVDGHRSRWATPVEMSEADHRLPSVEDDAERVVAAKLVDDALATLTSGHRAVLEEIYLADQSVAGAALRLGLPVGTVKSRTFYALRCLREATSALRGAEVL